ncbi:integrase, catalytic region [Parafrankia sp. EAN1pec]|nr:integrase, catalytic region [Frankia sp. EAN1pec]
MCTELGVSRSGYYAWRGGAPSRRSLDDTTYTTLIRKICAEGRGNPGVRRVRAGLAASGHQLSHKRVWRLMRAGRPARTPPQGLETHHDRRRPACTGTRPDRP